MSLANLSPNTGRAQFTEAVWLMRILEKIRSLWPPRADGGHSRERLMNAFQDKYVNFQSLLRSNTELLAIIADI